MLLLLLPIQLDEARRWPGREWMYIFGEMATCLLSVPSLNAGALMDDRQPGVLQVSWLS